MGPSTAQISCQLRQVVFYHLDNDLPDNGLFMAGRLHALEPRNADSIHLLALCHKRLGQFKTAYDYARSPALRGSHLGCAYVFAQSCLSLGRYMDGIAALEKSRPLWDGKNNWNSHTDSLRQHIPDAAAVYCLLGKLLQANRDAKRAVECYAEALKLNPFMWDAFERLCETGTNMRTSNVFKLSPEAAALLSHSTLQSNGESQRVANGSVHLQATNGNHSTTQIESDPFGPTKTASETTASTGMSSTLPRSLKARAQPISSDNPAPASNIETPQAPVAQEVSGVTRKASTASLGHGLEPPMAPMRKARTLQASGVDLNMGTTAKPRLLSSRGRGNAISDDGEPNDVQIPDAPVQHKRTVSGTLSQPTNASTAKSIDMNIRRSRRLFNQIRPNATKPAPATAAPYTKDVQEPRKAKATGTRGRSTVASAVGRATSTNRKPGELTENLPRESKTSSSSGIEMKFPFQKGSGLEHAHGRDLESVLWLLDLFGKLGQGYYSLTRYQCLMAVQCFNSVSVQQRDTPWVLAQIGKAYYEQNSYREAERTFARLRKMVPSRINDMEIYSTVLWHLKNDTELAFLSHELIDDDRLSAQAWCTIGNSFSLQREHNHALKCFRRATQLDPKFAYGFTLQGHEHIANEEYDKAMSAYRRAIAADNRHYNGWYGLGKVYEKLGDFDLAEKHYKAAASINPTNPVLVCCIGVVLEKMKRPQGALIQYTRACELQPSSTLSRYKKARTLLSLRCHQEALAELDILKDLAPDESNVHYMLGRTHARMKNKPLAIKHYTIAMNLDPKAAPYLKEHMESLDEVDDENAEDDDGDEEMT